MKKYVLAALAILATTTACAGTAGRIPKFSGSSSIVNSIGEESGSTWTVRGNLTSTGTVKAVDFSVAGSSVAVSTNGITFADGTTQTTAAGASTSTASFPYGLTSSTPTTLTVGAVTMLEPKYNVGTGGPQILFGSSGNDTPNIAASIDPNTGINILNGILDFHIGAGGTKVEIQSNQTKFNHYGKNPALPDIAGSSYGVGTGMYWGDYAGGLANGLGLSAGSARAMWLTTAAVTSDHPMKLTGDSEYNAVGYGFASYTGTGLYAKYSSGNYLGLSNNGGRVFEDAPQGTTIYHKFFLPYYRTPLGFAGYGRLVVYGGSSTGEVSAEPVSDAAPRTNITPGHEGQVIYNSTDREICYSTGTALDTWATGNASTPCSH